MVSGHLFVSHLFVGHLFVPICSSGQLFVLTVVRLDICSSGHLFVWTLIRQTLNRLSTSSSGHLFVFLQTIATCVPDLHARPSQDFQILQKFSKQLLRDNLKVLLQIPTHPLSNFQGIVAKPLSRENLKVLY